MKKFTMSAASMSRKTTRACLGIQLKNQWKTEFMQQRVNYIRQNHKFRRMRIHCLNKN